MNTSRKGYNMKKITSALLSLILMFSIAGCSIKKAVNDDALDALDAVIANMKNTKSADYEVEIEIPSDATKTLAMNGSYINEGSNPQLSASIDMPANGEQPAVKGFLQVFMKDKFLYYNMKDMAKQKLNLDFLTVETQVDNEKVEVKSLKDGVFRDYLSEATLKEGKITIEFAQDKISKAITENKASIEENPIFSFPTIDVNKLKLVVDTKDKIFQSVSVEVDVKGSGEQKGGKATIKLSLNNIDNVQAINYPDFNDYVEGNLGSLLQIPGVQ